MNITLAPRIISISILVLVFAYLYSKQKERYLGIWCFMGIVWLSSYMYRIITHTYSFEDSQLVIPIFTTITSYSILWGTADYLNKRFDKRITLIYIADVIWIFLQKYLDLKIFGLPFAATTSFIFSASFLWAGFMFIRTKTAIGYERTIVGTCIMLFGVIQVSFPWAGQRGFYDDIAGLVSMTLQYLMAISLIIYYFKAALHENKELHTQLEQSLTKIISGFIPICANCKSVRDDNQNWEALESYVSKHSDAKISHGICPDCKENLYPDLYPKK